jgi:Flp pilus assembly protein TadB
MTRDPDRRTEDRPRSIFERQWVGWAIVLALGLLALVVAVMVFAALPLLVAAFPLTIAALLIVLAIGYVRQRQRSRR